MRYGVLAAEVRLVHSIYGTEFDGFDGFKWIQMDLRGSTVNGKRLGSKRMGKRLGGDEQFGEEIGVMTIE